MAKKKPKRKTPLQTLTERQVRAYWKAYDAHAGGSLSSTDAGIAAVVRNVYRYAQRRGMKE